MKGLDPREAGIWSSMLEVRLRKVSRALPLDAPAKSREGSSD
jgi:hypothetical protein